MLERNQHAFASEFYVIEKTIEVVVNIKGENETIKIEAHHDLADGSYKTRAFIQENLTLQPTYPQVGGKFGNKPDDFRVYVDYDLPWTHRDSADEALQQALGFLRERTRA